MIWKIAAAVAAAYLVLVVFPGILSYAIIFSRKEGTPFDTIDLSGTKFACCIDEIKKGFAFFKEKESEKLSVENDGLNLYCDYYDRGSDKTAIFFHGYRSTPENNFFAMGPFLWDEGYNIAFVHQRGHADSEGKRIGVGLLEARDLLQWVKLFSEKPEQKSIILCGTSMGAATVEYASDKIKEASGNKVRAMILDCGFTSVYEQISRDSLKRKILPFGILPVIALCARLQLKINIREKTADHLKNSDVPAFFIQGALDETVPLSDTLKNYEAAGGKKEKYIVDNSYHAQAFSLGGDGIKEKLHAFLRDVESGD